MSLVRSVRRFCTSISKERHRTQYNYDPFTLHPSTDHLNYPLLAASQLASSSSRPRSCRMLSRDFIHDSLYNPNYGYFSKQAVLLPCTPFDIPSLASEFAFLGAVEERYDSFQEAFQHVSPGVLEDREEQKMRRKYTKQGLEEAQMRGRRMKNAVDEIEVQRMAARQVWHTPTQIFQPYYARAIARYLVAEYKLLLYPYADFTLYELGAGAGTLANDILQYLAQEEPEIYRRTRYRIVEISARLAEEQTKRLAKHRDVVRVENISFLDWKEHVPEPCFVVALEVLDNLTHDVVRYSTANSTPYQALVSIDGTGDMHELYEPVSDPLISRYLEMYHTLPSSPYHSKQWLPPSLTKHLPFSANLSQRHFLPTGSLQMLDVLRLHFPQHRLVLSDFDSLPDSLSGVSAPVVQTCLSGTMIPVTTYMVLQGCFDIFFPTNFALLREVYQNVMEQGYFTGRRNAVRLFSHAEFLERYAETEKTKTKDGASPMLSWYANASWFLS